jgi:hypothetical protein
MTRFGRILSVFLAVPPLATPPMLAATNGSFEWYVTKGIHSMDASGSVYRYIKVDNGIIQRLEFFTPPFADPEIVDAVMYPGFIDSHSHGFSLYSARTVGPSGVPNWVSLANVNVMDLPDCSPARSGAVDCYSPVTRQYGKDLPDSVENVIRSAKVSTTPAGSSAGTTSRRG